MLTQWSMRFEAEEVKVVALGAGWIAAVTNLNFLRIFTEGGLQACHEIALIFLFFSFSSIAVLKLLNKEFF